MRLLGPLLSSLLLAVLCSVAIVIWLGESPAILTEAFYNTFFTSFGLGYTLFYSTPLIFTGLSVALCFHAGLFNIGAEGQLLWGSIAIVALGHWLPEIPWFLAVPVAILVAALAGGLGGLVAGFFKAFRGSHEVVTTLLLNFIAQYWVSYLILYQFKNPLNQASETEVISNHYWIPTIDLFRTTPVNLTLVIAIISAVLIYYYLFHTVSGFELRAMGNNKQAAQYAGINLKYRTVLVFFISGALAGLVGVNEVMGSEHKVIEGFSPGYGFTGIAVALLARNHPLGIIVSAILFGSLQNTARELEFLSENVSKEVSLVIQGVLIAFVAFRLRGKSND